MLDAAHASTRLPRCTSCSDSGMRSAHSLATCTRLGSPAGTCHQAFQPLGAPISSVQKPASALERCRAQGSNAQKNAGPVATRREVRKHMGTQALNVPLDCLPPALWFYSTATCRTRTCSISSTTAVVLPVPGGPWMSATSCAESAKDTARRCDSSKPEAPRDTLRGWSAYNCGSGSVGAYEIRVRPGGLKTPLTQRARPHRQHA
jgi:hypothetical protein